MATTLAPGQVAVVTGAASGIGLALARAFVTRGLRVVVSDVREDALAAAVAGLRSGGADVVGVVADVADAAAVDGLAAVTRERFGRVDVVCNNAGVAPPMRPSWEQDLAAWRWVVDVGLLGVVNGIRSFVPQLVAQGSGHVLNTASIAGLVPVPMLAPYVAVKSAVVALSATLAAELAMTGAGVGVTVLCPAMVATGIADTSQALRPAGVSDSQQRQDADRVRSGGGVLSPASVAAMAIDGMAAGRLHVLTHPESAEPVRRRVDRMLADLPTL